MSAKSKKAGPEVLLVVTRNGGTLYVQAQLPLRALNAFVTKATQTFTPPIVEGVDPSALHKPTAKRRRRR